MKIALVGYGKMGKAIETLLPSNHEVVLKVTSANASSYESDLAGVDGIIEFSRPDTVLKNISIALERNIPIVVGTTAWQKEHLAEVSQMVKNHQGSLLHASNFSVGVNLFFHFAAAFAAKMKDYQADYQCEIEEIHHLQKLDAPSGTAITLAEQVLPFLPQKDWSLKEEQKEHTLTIDAIRTAGVPGTHELHFKSEIDTISLKHEAHNRKGFALGAIQALEWLVRQDAGIYTMNNVLNIS